VLFELCVLDHSRGWVQQFHLGALRNTNPRMFRTLGPDTGYDCIGNFDIVRPLARLLGNLEDRNTLAKTILYSLHPADNEALAALAGCFQDGSTPGKIQFGSAWWFLDQKDGIERQITALSNLGVLSCFVGMLTDSRSFLSYPRHEYFRRILCQLLARDMDTGTIPTDLDLVGKMVADISYNNARHYFDFFGNPDAAEGKP
jgi:glucuronate isomerase